MCLYTRIVKSQVSSYLVKRAIRGVEGHIRKEKKKKYDLNTCVFCGSHSLVIKKSKTVCKECFSTQHDVSLVCGDMISRPMKTINPPCIEHDKENDILILDFDLIYKEGVYAT